jgi:hypothetical protein
MNNLGLGGTIGVAVVAAVTIAFKVVFGFYLLYAGHWFYTNANDFLYDDDYGSHTLVSEELEHHGESEEAEEAEEAEEVEEAD